MSQQHQQQTDPHQGSFARQMGATEDDSAAGIHTDNSTINANLKVPADPLSNSSSRPESPVNRKRADDDSTSGQGRPYEEGSLSRNSLPPTKKSKTSPPLAPTNSNNNNVYTNSSSNSGHSLTEYRTSTEFADDALSPQTSPILEPLMPLPAASLSEKRYSPVMDLPVQSKARKLDDDNRPTSPPFLATSPSFRVGSPPFRASSPSFGRSATAILDSLSKPGENSLGNLNLGTPIIGRTPVGERVMGVITSQPNSRQSSPDPRPTSGVAETTKRLTMVAVDDIGSTELDVVGAESGADADLNDTIFSLDDIPQTITERAEREASPPGAMRISSEDDSHDFDEDDDDPIDALGEETMHPVDEEHGYDSDSDDEFGHDSMDEIDVEGIGMLDEGSDSERDPYDDPDPMCLDRFTEEETDIILEEARMHGIAFVIRKYVLSGLVSAKKMLLMTIPEKIELPDNLTENDLIRAISDRLKRILRRRKRLEHIHSLEHVVQLLKTSKRIMVLTGAGVSVSCGIPDFRSEDGIYSRLSEFELDDPQQMFDLDFFRERPQIFYSFAREIFPSNFTPSPSHYFIKLLEDQEKLLRNYTQNIDTLEQKAGIRKVLQCHGSFATASCVRCGHQVPGDDIKDQIFKQEVAYCKVCKTPSPPPKAKAKAKKRSKSAYHSSDEDESDDDDDDMNKALMKPDIVFFGEKLPAVFHQSLKEDRGKVDLLIVIGSSLKVAPVSDIMHQLPNSVPQILINRTPNRQMEFDVQLLGNCDAIVAELCRMAGWELKHEKLPGGTSNVSNMDKNTNKDGSGTGGRAAWSLLEPNTYLFEGADLEELNFQAIQEKNRRRVQDKTADQTLTEGAQDEDEDDDDDDDVEDMEGLTMESSRRRLLSGDRASSTGLMDEDEPEDDEEDEDDSDDGSEESQDTVKGTTVSSSTTLQTPTVAPTSGSGLALLLSPRLQPIGFATGTTEPRSGSITEIHQGTLSATKVEASRSLSASLTSPSSTATGLWSPTFGAASSASSLKYRGVLQSGDDGEEEDEDVKIRAMFTEKMPKDLGVDDGDGSSPGGAYFGHSRRPSEDLVPITEDSLEVDVEDDSDDNDAGNASMQVQKPSAGSRTGSDVQKS